MESKDSKTERSEEEILESARRKVEEGRPFARQMARALNYNVMREDESTKGLSDEEVLEIVLAKEEERGQTPADELERVRRDFKERSDKPIQ